MDITSTGVQLAVRQADADFEGKALGHYVILRDAAGSTRYCGTSDIQQHFIARSLGL
jgi:hypothetical protein